MLENKNVKMNLPKIYLLIIFLMINSSFCYSSMSIIEGQFLNYNPNTGTGVISICNTVFGLNGQKCKEVLIESTGAFKTEIELYRTTEIVIAHNENYISFPIKPNQKIYVKLDDKEFRTAKRIPKNIEIDGDNKASYKIVFDYRFKWLKRFFYHKFFENNKMSHELDYKDYYDYQNKHLKEELAFLKDYIEVNEIRDTFFIDWAASNIKYTYGYNLYHFYFFKSKILLDPIPKGFLDSIEQVVPINKAGAINSSSYEDYLHYKKMSLSIDFEKSEEGRRLIDDKKEVWEEKMKYLIDHSQGLGKDIMLGKLMDEYLNEGQLSVVEKYLNEIEDGAINKLINARIEEFKIVN